jgi:hypothetical protein
MTCTFLITSEAEHLIMCLLIIQISFLMWGRVLLYSPWWPWTCSLAQAALKFLILRLLNARIPGIIYGSWLDKCLFISFALLKAGLSFLSLFMLLVLYPKILCQNQDHKCFPLRVLLFVHFELIFNIAWCKGYIIALIFYL